MDDRLLPTILAPLFDDIQPDDDFAVRRPLLAHYTSIHVLEQVLTTNELWFSNPLMMNDVEEVRFGISSAVQLLLSEDFVSAGIAEACNTSARAELVKTAFLQCSNIFSTDHALDTYVFCLSEHEPHDNDGLLSMWRGYGANGNGVAIVFDSAHARRTPGSPLLLAKVHYGSTDARIEWLRNLLKKFARCVKGAGMSDIQLLTAVSYLFERIKLFALFTKHDGFREEREWRVVYLKERDHHGTFQDSFGYYAGPRGIEPKFKLRIETGAGPGAFDVSLSTLIERIILGPSASSPLAVSTVRRMLDRLGKPEVQDKIRASTIPFRSIHG